MLSALKLSSSSVAPFEEGQKDGFLFEGQISLGGRRWKMGEENPRLILALCQRFGLSEILGRLLDNRGIDLEKAENYLKPTLRALLPDPFHLKDMEKGVMRVIAALEAQEKIAVFGDYDVDGATSSALLKNYFRDIGKEVQVYIPNRLTEGYGPNTPALQKLQKEGNKVVILVDCGTTSFDTLGDAAKEGLDVVVIDHHKAQNELPPAVALINPNRLDETSPYGYLCAAGLTFLFLVALNQRLREKGWFQDKPEPDLRQSLDLVALGTVCDVMPLVDLNRAYVSQGLKVMKHRRNMGLAALADVAGCDEAPTPYHLGFLLGPRINAGGRIGQSDLGVTLLTTPDSACAARVSKTLHELNQERQEIEKQVLEEALTQVANQRLDEHPVILVGQEGWHPGVIGIVASRLKERFHKPSCVVGFENEIGKGSGRSVTGFSLGDAMHQGVKKGLLSQGGGHEMAAGFSLHKEKFEAFRDFLNDYALNNPFESVPTLILDGALHPRAITPRLQEELAFLEPYGTGNATPRFLVGPVKIIHAERVGIAHVRCTFVSEEGDRLKGIAFRSLETALGQTLLNAGPRAFVYVAGTLKSDTRSVSFSVEDMLMMG